MPPQIVSEVEIVPVGAIECHPRNPNQGEVEGIAGSMDESGLFWGVLLVQRSTGYVLIGNHRLKAARLTGMTEVPIQWVDCDDDRAMEILICDNQWAKRARWNDRLLLSELDRLPSLNSRLLGLKPLDVELLRQGLDDDDDSSGEGDSSGGGSPSAEVTVQVGDYSFTVSRERFDRWRGEVTTAAGHAADAVAEEIAARLHI